MSAFYDKKNSEALMACLKKAGFDAYMKYELKKKPRFQGY